MEKKSLALVKGQPYLVKSRNGRKIGNLVRRIYKGEELRFGSIKCFVFTSRVNRGAYAEFSVENGQTVITYKKLTKNIEQEISIPFYDLMYITPAPNL